MTQQINLYNPDLIPRQLLFSAIGLAQALGAGAIGMLLIQVYGLLAPSSNVRFLPSRNVRR